jgi:class 3 adenylate cyclase
MDRHDLPGATAEMVAQAHLSDLQKQASFDVQFLAYWFDAETGEVFCLAKAAQPEAMQAVHEAAHGLVPNEIISVSEDNVVRFLGKITDPSEHGQATSAFRTILFTDLQGSTALLQEVGEGAYMGYLGEHDLIIRRALLAARGREVKHTGDGIMAAFTSVVSSVGFAMEVQRRVHARNENAVTPFHVSVGISAGEPVTDDNEDLFGAAVQLAARLCAAAPPGDIAVSVAVRELCIGKPLRFEYHGELDLKGLPPTQTYVVPWRE